MELGQLKFRSWDFGVMMYDDCVQPLLINRKDHLHHFFKYISQDDDAIVMQYTGLKDKNGKEIYEGDIVGVIDTFSLVVTFIDGKFCFKHDSNFGSDALSADRCKRLEVIGNIYENPELLEVAASSYNL